MSLRHVNSQLFRFFTNGERVGEVQQKMEQLVVPVLYVLQQRASRQEQRKAQGPESSTVLEMSALTSRTLEEVRGQWCQLLGDTEDPSRQELSDILTAVLEPPVPKDFDAGKLKNLDMNQQTDLNLASAYKEAYKQMKDLEVK